LPAHQRAAHGRPNDAKDRLENINAVFACLKRGDIEGRMRTPQ